MYLTSIKLAGFKSFVDPTKIPIRSNMSAIVGPNGCGKSNIVDAIRWVIGESSAKQLRGQSMSDVIFNGTTGRKPVGRATVELHFDNSAGRITGEYAKYTDLVIRREVERDGQSDYFLNGIQCRRRDILDVFLGTGLGPRSYSIIEQGMISQMIESKPEEMRAHLEEVAGISKYKERRRETETRIQHTKDNLDRLNDIREELDKQLRHLKRQANAAERYKILKEEEREVIAHIKALHWQLLEQKRNDQQEKLNKQLLLREQKISLQREYEAEINKIKVKQDESQETQQEVQKRYYKSSEEVVRLEQQIKNHQEQLQRWRQEYANIDQMWRELEETSIEHREQIREFELELVELTPQESTVNEVLNAAQEAFRAANANMQAWQKAWDDYQEQFASINSQRQVTSTKIDYHQQQQQQLNDRRQNSLARLQQLAVSELESEIQPLSDLLDDKKNTLETHKNNLQNYQQQISSQRETNKTLQQNVQNKQRELQRVEAEYAKTAALQQAALGCNDESSANWLTKYKLMTHPRLGKTITVTSGWEKAVETVLSGYFDAVCVDQLDVYMDSLTDLTEGQITLVEKNEAIAAIDHPSYTSLLSKIESNGSFAPWLQGIYVAQDLSEARALQKNLANNESVITVDGIWLGQNWIRINNLPDSQRGILEREKSLQQLTQQIKMISTAKAELEQQQKQGELELVTLEQSRDALQQTYQQCSTELSEVQSRYSAKTIQIENSRVDQLRLQAELANIERGLADTEIQLTEFMECQQEFKLQEENLNDKRNALMAEREHCQQCLESAREGMQKQQQHLDELSIRLSANESQLGLLRQTVQRSEKQLAQMAERREFLVDQLSSDDSPIEKLQNELQEKLSQRLTTERELKLAESNLTDLRQRLKECDRMTQRIIEEINVLQTQLEQLRMDGQEISVRQQTIKEQLAEMMVELDTLLTTLPEEAEISTSEARLQEITQKINRLGPINLAAIDEFQSGSERKDYLDKQFQDLTESLETLEAAIHKIDRESKARFRETFDKVNQGFQEIFPQIFGGGRASLELSENDLLKTGIIVRAQPPGKRNSTIHMLSGGEKALTAIALIFAMFQLNPAPFCILDEVDAPLDDLNVGRFCQIVKQMAKETQFLIISHNKVTIESADHLLGVTMQEAGVSRLVAVDIAEALKMVEAV